MRSTALLLVVLAGCGEQADQPEQLRQALSSSVVISEIYGGGGSTNAPFDSDFIELFNRGSSTVSINGWTLQVATEASPTFTAVPLTGAIDAGQSYLVRMGPAGTSGAPLPAVDATAAAPIGITGGKVLLVSSGTVMNGVCPTSSLIVDLVGYGPNATCFEAVRAPSPSATESLQRRDDGCVERDNNAADFVLAGPTPTPLTTAERVCSRDAGIFLNDGGFVEPDGGCLVISSFPSVATRGGYDRVNQRAFARLFTQEPTASNGQMERLSLEAAFFSGLMVPATRALGGTSQACELCVSYGRRCTRSVCFEEFFAQSGEARVTQADQLADGGRLLGEIANVRLVRWDFANDRPVPGGQCVVIPSLAVDVSWPDIVPMGGGRAGDGGAGGGSADGGSDDAGTADGGADPEVPRKGCGCGATTDSLALMLVALLISRRFTGARGR